MPGRGQRDAGPRTAARRVCISTAARLPIREDNNSTAVNLAARPIASKVPVVTAQSEGGYYYQLTFLPPGNYTVALDLRCRAG